MLNEQFRRQRLQPSELNRLIADYLHESNYTETLEAFSKEASIQNISVAKMLLRKLVNKGMYGAILEQKIFKFPISLLESKERLLISPRAQVQTQQFSVDVLQQDYVLSFKNGETLFVLLKKDSDLQIHAVENQKPQLISKIQGEQALFFQDHLYVLQGYSLQKYNLPGIELIDQRPIQRGGQLIRFFKTDGQQTYANIFEKYEVDDLFFYRSLVLYNINTQFTIHQRLFDAYFDMSEIVACSVVYKTCIHENCVLIATDVGLVKATFRDKDLSTISAVPFTLPADDFIVFEYFQQITTAGFVDIMCSKDRAAVVLENEFYLIKISTGVVLNHIQTSKICYTCSHEDYFALCSCSEVYFYGREDFRLAVDFKEVMGLSCCGGFLIILHDRLAEIVSLE